MYLNVGELSDYAKKVFREGIGHSLVLEMKKRGTEPATSTQKACDQQANQMIDVFAQSGHRVSRCTRAVRRGTLKRKQGRNTIHFTGDSEKY